MAICYSIAMLRIHVTIPKEYLERLDIVSQETGLRRSDLIRRALEEYLDGIFGKEGKAE